MSTHSQSHDQSNDSINVTDPTSNKKVDSFQSSDIEELYKRAKPQNWQDLQQYVKKQGDSTWHITPGEAKAIEHAVDQAIAKHVPFASSPDKAYQELSQFGTTGKAGKGSSSHG